MDYEKESKILIIVISGLFLIFFGCGILMYTNHQKIQKELSIQKAKENSENKKVNFKNSEIKNLISDITTALNRPCGYYDYFKNDVLFFNNLSNSDVFRIAIMQIYNDKKDSGTANPFAEGTIINASEVEAKIAKILPSNYQFTHQNFITDFCPNFIYNPTTNSYTISASTTCENTCIAKNSYHIDNIKNYEDHIDVYIRIAFADISNDNTILYYSDFKKTKLLKVFYSQENPNLSEEDYQKATLYCVTFNIQNNNYVFNSTRKVS